MIYDSYPEAKELEGTLESDPAPLSVTAALTRSKQMLESFTLSIVGEVSELSDKPSYKAVYFSIKDNNSHLPCQMWKNRFKLAGVPLKLGDKIIVTGRFTVYAAKGRMNFEVSSIQAQGEGSLRQQILEIQRRLTLEGLIDPQKRKPLPELPSRIGLITSGQGACVHDVLRTLRRRNPLIEIDLAAVIIEGKDAVSNMIAAFDCLEPRNPELILLVRGGGSLQDFMPFNSELLARRIAACSIPVITGIGHEPDTSIADMVADLRASTPTAAAEAISPHQDDLLARIDLLSQKATTQLSLMCDSYQERLDALSTRPLFSDPRLLYQGQHHLLYTIDLRLTHALKHLCARPEALLDRLSQVLANQACNYGKHELHLLEILDARLHDLSPLAHLKRGFALVRKDEHIIDSISTVAHNDSITVQLKDGFVTACVTAIDEVVIEEFSSLE